MKSTIKLFLVVCLFSSAVLADDGEMPTGNRNCPNGATTCFVAPAATTEEETKQTTADDSILTTVQEYLDSLVEYFAS
jgi:hypothetical protein